MRMHVLSIARRLTCSALTPASWKGRPAHDHCSRISTKFRIAERRQKHRKIMFQPYRILCAGTGKLEPSRIACDTVAERALRICANRRVCHIGVLVEMHRCRNYSLESGYRCRLKLLEYRGPKQSIVNGARTSRSLAQRRRNEHDPACLAKALTRGSRTALGILNVKLVLFEGFLPMQ